MLQQLFDDVAQGAGDDHGKGAIPDQGQDAGDSGGSGRDERALFADRYYGYDDAILCRFPSIECGKADRPLSQLLADLLKHNT
jgi:hypothetical protein